MFIIIYILLKKKKEKKKINIIVTFPEIGILKLSL